MSSQASTLQGPLQPGWPANSEEPQAFQPWLSHVHDCFVFGRCVCRRPFGTLLQCRMLASCQKSSISSGNSSKSVFSRSTCVLHMLDIFAHVLLRCIALCLGTPMLSAEHPCSAVLLQDGEAHFPIHVEPQLLHVHSLLDSTSSQILQDVFSIATHATISKFCQHCILTTENRRLEGPCCVAFRSCVPQRCLAPDLWMKTLVCSEAAVFCTMCFLP